MAEHTGGSVLYTFVTTVGETDRTTIIDDNGNRRCVYSQPTTNTDTESRKP